MPNKGLRHLIEILNFPRTGRTGRNRPVREIFFGGGEGGLTREVKIKASN